MAWAPEDTVTTRAGALCLEPIQQQVGQQERGEVVDGEGVLQAVGGDVPGGPEPAHVVDQHVQARVRGEDLTGQTAHLGLDGQVGYEHIDGRVARRCADVASGGLGPGAVAANDADSGAQGR